MFHVLEVEGQPETNGGEAHEAEAEGGHDLLQPHLGSCWCRIAV